MQFYLDFLFKCVIIITYYKSRRGRLIAPEGERMSSIAVNFFGEEHLIQVDFFDAEDLAEPDIDIEYLKQKLNESLAETGYSTRSPLNHRVLDEDEMDCLAYHAQRNCVECQRLILIFCGRLVHSQAKKSVLHDRGDSIWDYEDLFNSGCIGVITSLKTWRMSKGHFTSWATYAIMGKISEQKRQLYSPIFIKNEHLWRLSLSLSYLTLQCESEMERPVSLGELAEWLNENGHAKTEVTVEDLYMINKITSPVSLDMEIIDEDNSPMQLSDRVEDMHAEQPDENILKEERVELLHNLLGRLNRKHKLVFELYNRIDEETRNMSGFITFRDVVRILKKRYPKEKWSVKACEESNRRAWQKLKQIAATIDE